MKNSNRTPSTFCKKRKITSSSVDDLLVSQGLKKTPLRSQLLKALQNSQTALTQSQIIEELSQKKTKSIDRVSVYRNLVQLKKKGVLHEVETNQYILCSHECSEHIHILLFCPGCQTYKEVHHHEQIKTVMDSLKDLRFFGELSKPLFLKTICSQCFIEGRE